MVIDNFLPPPREETIRLAKAWIDNADAVLICAGAGMSVKEGEMVYTNPEDFAKAYPWFTKWGYKTNYEVMGLEGDPRVPRTAKWALYAKHMDNMRWTFTPNDGYKSLLSMVKDKDYFVHTSNVDACFERSGFSKDRIYTPQGEWTYLQCTEPCHEDSVFESRPYLDIIIPQISSDGSIRQESVPKCPRCGGEMFGNVRAGNNFCHYKYDSQNDKLRAWMEGLLQSPKKKVAIIEIGAGFNTPTVTRFPMESFAHELGNRGKFIRINPTEPEIPHELSQNAVAMDEGWQVLHEMTIATKPSSLAVNPNVMQYQQEKDIVLDSGMMNRYKNYFGHFDWRRFLHQLKR
uniref:Deacetylase sirtuin-type domain-containing protein n=1 Tax=Pseudictyota dubia TaxID=2749911 RepID=A0A7R9WER9_9STRA